MEDNLKDLLKEQVDKHAEKQERDIKEMKERQSKDMEEVRSLLLNLQQPGEAAVTVFPSRPIRSEREIAYMKSMQPKLSRLEFLKFCGDNLYYWLFKCN